MADDLVVVLGVGGDQVVEAERQRRPAGLAGQRTAGMSSLRQAGSSEVW